MSWFFGATSVRKRTSGSMGQGVNDEKTNQAASDCVGQPVVPQVGWSVSLPFFGGRCRRFTALAGFCLQLFFGECALGNCVG